MSAIRADNEQRSLNDDHKRVDVCELADVR